MADLVLRDGKTVTIDLGSISHLEFMRLMSSKDDDPEQARLLGKVAGMTADDIGNLPQSDWLRLVSSIVAASKETIENPK